MWHARFKQLLLERLLGSAAGLPRRRALGCSATHRCPCRGRRTAVTGRKDLAWEASCPSGVTGRGKKHGKKKAAPDDDRRQTTEVARRRRVVFGNVAFDIIQV